MAAWNEHDPVARRKLLDRACADDVVVRTGGGRTVEGRAALDAWIGSFQERCPGDRAVFTSGIDVQGWIFRYSGAVALASGAPGGEALDTGACDDAGRITWLLTFVGTALPARA